MRPQWVGRTDPATGRGRPRREAAAEFLGTFAHRASPTPGFQAAGGGPLSLTVTTEGRPVEHLDVNSVADACCTTLLTASTAVRQAATSTAAGTAAESGTRRSAAARRHRRAGRSGASGAPARPSSSRAAGAGRRPGREDRDHLAGDLLRIGQVSPSSRSERPSWAGGVEVEAQTGEHRPSPSWRSRRSRRRSSSRAVTSRCRASWQIGGQRFGACTEPATSWAMVASTCGPGPDRGVPEAVVQRPARR